MPIATPSEYQEMIDAARADGFAYPAINVTSSQTLNAALGGFAEAKSDGIIQITTGAATYFAGPAADMDAGARAFAEYAHVIAARVPILVGLHTDHCTPEHVDEFIRPLLQVSRDRCDRGLPPLFNSHMFDGSQLPLAENLRIAAELLRETSELGIVLELEIGTVGGEEDGIDHTGAPSERLYTTPADAVAVADALGYGERGRYLLAATFGNVHGHYAPGNVKLRPELLGDLQRAVESRSRGNGHFDFVFHGGSGSTSDEIRTAIANGVVKMNLDTDMQYAFTHAIEAHFAQSGERHEGKGIDKPLYDPRAWGRNAEKAMEARVVEASEILGSHGRTLRSH
jgi:fructose-bisphosphate aldolase class II